MTLVPLKYISEPDDIAHSALWSTSDAGELRH